jgi:hypothetical protein
MMFYFFIRRSWGSLWLDEVEQTRGLSRLLVALTYAKAYALLDRLSGKLDYCLATSRDGSVAHGRSTAWVIDFE